MQEPFSKIYVYAFTYIRRRLFYIFKLFILLYFLLQAENKLDIIYIPEILEAAPKMMDSLLELLKTDLAPVLNFPPMLDAIDDIKTFLKELKKFIDKYLETTAAEIKDYEEKLSVVMERLIHLEEHKDEL